MKEDSERVVVKVEPLRKEEEVAPPAEEEVGEEMEEEGKEEGEKGEEKTEEKEEGKESKT
jgi:hypothetical protein